MALTPLTPVATSPDDYSLTIEEACSRYEHAGHPRTIRSIQRYCSRGDLECLRKETAFGDKYMITPASVARHIAQIDEVTQVTSRDMSRLVVAQESPSNNAERATDSHDKSRQDVAMTPPVALENQQSPSDMSRHVATTGDFDKKYVNQLEGEIAFLRDEISTKNAQIKELSERSRETNLLIGGLQRMLSPLLGSPDPHPPRDIQSGM